MLKIGFLKVETMGESRAVPLSQSFQDIRGKEGSGGGEGRKRNRRRRRFVRSSESPFLPSSFFHPVAARLQRGATVDPEWDSPHFRISDSLSSFAHFYTTGHRPGFVCNMGEFLGYLRPPRHTINIAEQQLCERAANYERGGRQNQQVTD